jgi:hypothetical protein
LWCSRSGDHPESDLAKFSYILDTKVGGKKNPFYILGYLLELIIKIWLFGFLFSLKSGESGSFFHEMY